MNEELLRNNMLKQNVCALEILSSGHLSEVYGLNERRFIGFCSLKRIAENKEKIYNDVKNIGARSILPLRVLDDLFHGFITALFKRTCEKLRVL